MDIFRHDSYRSIINAWLNSQTGVGGRTDLAKSAGCNPSWISRVLAGTVELTPEQSYAIALHVKFNEAETEYFLALVDCERAGTPQLKKRLEAKIAAYRSRGRDVGSSAKIDSHVLDKYTSRYYSSWIYAAVHVACMIQGFSIEELANLLRLTIATVESVLEDLEKMKLVGRQMGKWTSLTNLTHLSTADSVSGIGHILWRNRTIQQLQEHPGEGLHYSAIHCLSEKDVTKIRSCLKETVLESRKTIERSKSEVLSVLCLDWYRI